MKEIKKPKRLCGAKTRSGTPCEKFPVAGKRRCRLHGGASTGPKSKEGRDRIAAARLKHGQFVNWRARREKEKVYYKKIRMVMAQAREAGLIEE